MTCLVFDIETRRNEALWSDPVFCEEIRSKIEPRDNLKDPVKIEADIAAKYDKLLDRAATRPVHGVIACIAVCELDSDVVNVWADDDEAAVIAQFAGALDAAGDRVVLGGWNIREFDVPFVTARAGVHGIKLPRWWPHRKSWNKIVDPCDLFGRFEALDDFLREFGLPRKTMTGKESLALGLPELADYCANDVRSERLLIERLRDRFDALNPERVSVPTPVTGKKVATYLEQRIAASMTRPSGIGADPARQMPFTLTELREVKGVGDKVERRLREFFQSKGVEVRA